MRTVSDVIAGGTEGVVQQGPVRDRVLNDLSANIRATNILLQGIPKAIYSLINHYTEAKDIWENMKMILEGSELTKDDRESQLYDEFEHFRQNKGETIQGYYQHEVHANENRTMMERFLQPTNDPLALVSNASVQHSSTENLIESLSNSLALLTQSYKSHLPQTNNQLRTSSNARNKATVQDDRVVEVRTEEALLILVKLNPLILDEEQSLFLAGEQITNFDDDVDDSPENDLALNVDHIFEADQCDTFDSDVDEA
ncbi:hypothetical protein Tco_0037183, partial [Tanacetum coccineum]